MGMAAQLEPERGTSNRRNSARRRLRLEVIATADHGPTNTVLHDLSNSGFLLETRGNLSPGDELRMDLPEARGRPAIVVWRSGQLYGCALHEPVSSAALSAALLKAGPHAPPPPSAEPELLQDNIAEPELSTAAKLRICLGLAVACWTVPAGLFFLV